MTSILYFITGLTCVGMLFILGVVSAYTIRRDTEKMTKNFEIQMTAAKTNKMPEINKLSYSDLMKIVNDTIDYYTTKDLTINSLTNKSPEEISLILDEISSDVATKVKVSVSPYVSQCITCYVTEDFYDKYILNSVRGLLIANIEYHKRMTKSNVAKKHK